MGNNTLLRCLTGFLVFFVPLSGYLVPFNISGLLPDNLLDWVVILVFVGVVLTASVRRKLWVGDKKSLYCVAGIFSLLVLIELIANESSWSFLLSSSAVLLVFWSGAYVSCTPSATLWARLLAFSAGGMAFLSIGQFLNFFPLFDVSVVPPAHAARLQFLADWGRGSGALSLTGSRGSNGIWLLAGLVGSLCVMYSVKQNRKLRRLGCIANIFFINFACILSQSRSTYLAFAIFWVFLGTYYLFGLNGKSGTHLSVGLKRFALVTIGGMVFVGVSLATAKWELSTVALRLDQYTGAFDKMLENPVVGNFGEFLLEQKGRFGGKEIDKLSPTHNFFLHLGASYGVLVMMLAIWLVINFFRTGLQRLGHATSPELRFFLVVWLAGALGVVIEMLLFTGTFSKPLWAFWGVGFGYLYRTQLKESALNNTQPSDRAA